MRIHLAMCAAALAITALSACERAAPPPDKAAENAAIAKADAALEELAATRKALADAEQAAKQSALDAVAEAQAEAPQPLDLCWQDYCPCEPGQDGKGLEASLCRNLKAGIPVDDDIMASAAMMRDARRQIRDFERDNPGF